MTFSWLRALDAISYQIQCFFKHCFPNLTSASRETPFSTTADETRLEWRIQSLNTRGIYLWSLSEHSANSFDFRAEFNFFCKEPFVFASWESSQILSLSNASSGAQISLGFYRDMYFKSLQIGLCVASNIMYWNASFHWTSLNFSVYDESEISICH